MTNIQINFNKYLPIPSGFYQYYEVLLSHNFIKGIEVLLDTNNDPKIKIFRFND